MENRVAVNREVSVTAMYFRRTKELKTFPKRMEFDGHEYTFIESGLQYLIRKGQRVVRFFDMTDGNANYRLKFDNDAFTWTLVSITNNSRAGY
jgi:hypothetical protein